jgi:hypothetical protein
MASRRLVIVGSVIAGAILAATTFGSSGATEDLERTSLVEAWTLSAPGATTIVATRLAPGAEPVLVVQGPGFVQIAGTDGVAGARKAIPGLAVAATSDVTGDGADDVLVASGPTATVQALDSRLEALWSSGPLAGMRAPARLAPADLDRDDRRELLVGDAAGRVSALSPSGKPLWSWAFTEAAQGDAAAVRGLDDQRVGAERRVVVARRSGELAVLDAAGKLLKQERLPAGIRRLRLIDVDGDKDPEILVGAEDGSRQLPAGKGDVVFLTRGEAITEIRRVETDGNASTAELALGGKDGGIALLSGVRHVASARVGGKISDLAGVDLTGDGRDEIVVGTENGQIVVFDGTGRHLASHTAGGKVERVVSIVSPLRERLAVVAAGPRVVAYRLKTQSAPAWYTPAGAGALGLVVLGVVAGTLLGGGSPRTPAAASASSALASIAKVEALVARGVVSADAAADRIAQLRRQAR